MKLDRAELLRVEAQLLADQVSAEALPLLLESVRHMQRCGQRRGAVTTSTERRRKRGSKGNQPKGHGRDGADAYSGARRVAVPHRPATRATRKVRIASPSIVIGARSPAVATT